MKKVLVLSVVLLLIALPACNLPMPTPAAVAPDDTPASEGPPGWLTYTDELNGFSIQYPAEGSLHEGEQVLILLPVTPGTNLIEKYLQIEARPSSGACRTPLVSAGEIEAAPATFNGIEFIQEQGGDAGAGNYYAWQSYSAARGSTCLSLGFILHSSNPMFYDTPPAAYDPALEAEVFTQMMETFRWLP